MTGLVPLFLMYLYSRNGMRAAPSMPSWPTPASPPPPMPAFQPQPPPATADTATPLPELQASQPAPPPMPVEPGRVTPKPKTPAARAAAAKKMLQRKFNVKIGPARVAPATPVKNAAVSDLQAILNARGAKLKRDGLFGPKTANAWANVARSRGLPPSIARVGPKVARVATQTYDALRLPPIP